MSATGLTYAQYARSGFFQLAVVSVFVLAIVAAPDGVSAPITTPCAPASRMVATSRSMAAISCSS
ncbi:DUF4153 domain-containing protein [Streptosporangium sandarakinum]